METKLINIKDIIPDPNQPRKSFDAKKLAELISSIKRFGIMSPLSVEKMKDGTYIIENGERRYRAALELGLSKLPCNVFDEVDDDERLIRQFHIQEQQSNWTAVEKANAIGQLAEARGLNASELAKELCVDKSIVRQYQQYYALNERKFFEKNNIPIAFAQNMNIIKNVVKKLSEEVFEEEFDKDSASQLEKRLIKSVTDGEIKKAQEFTRLADSFKKDPDNIKKYMSGSESIDSMYIKSKAKEESYLRRLKQSTPFVEDSLNKVIDAGLITEAYEYQDMKVRLSRIARKIQIIIGSLD